MTVSSAGPRLVDSPAEPRAVAPASLEFARARTGDRRLAAALLVLCVALDVVLVLALREVGLTWGTALGIPTFGWFTVRSLLDTLGRSRRS